MRWRWQADAIACVSAQAEGAWQARPLFELLQSHGLCGPVGSDLVCMSNTTLPITNPLQQCLLTMATSMAAVLTTWCYGHYVVLCLASCCPGARGHADEQADAVRP